MIAPQPAFTSVTHVIFDLDGTLIDGYRPIYQSVNVALAALGYPPASPNQVRPLVGQGLEWLLARFVRPEHVPDAVRLYRDHYGKIYLDGNFLLAGAERVLSALHRAHFGLAVVSNKPGDRVRPICDHLGISPYLDVVLGAGDVPTLKPDPEMLLLALERLHASSADSLYVGDTPTDLQTARAARVPVVSVLGGSATCRELLDAGATLIIDNLDQLPGLLRHD